MLTFFVNCGASLTLSYDIDCFKVRSCPVQFNEKSMAGRRKEIAGECMVSVITIRKCLGFARPYGINPCINAMGLRRCIITIAKVSYTRSKSLWWNSLLDF